MVVDGGEKDAEGNDEHEHLPAEGGENTNAARSFTCGCCLKAALLVCTCRETRLRYSGSLRATSLMACDESHIKIGTRIYSILFVCFQVW